MAKMSRQTKLMFIAVTFISIVQNPLMAATPAIDLIHTEVFPTYSLSTIQSVTQSSFFILVFSTFFLFFCLGS